MKTGVAYIRESTEEQDKGFSPENQKRTILEYAKKHDIKIVGFYKDLISGRLAAKRTDFQKMMDDAMQKKFEVILVYHTSRFARNIEESRQYKKLLREKLNIDVVSVTQPFGDFNNPNSFLNEGINELFDEYTSRNIGFWVRSGLMEKRKQGKPVGNPPLGYYRKKLGFDSERNRPFYSKEWYIDKKGAAIARKIFKMYATGNYSMGRIAESLTKAGHRTKLGNPFTYSSIKGTLQNKSYLGLVYSPRKPLPDVRSISHKALIPKSLFDKCQDVIRERKGKFGRPVAQHRFYLLQGLVYCYPCIKHMKGNEKSSIRRMQPSMYCEYHRDRHGKEYLQYTCKFKRENYTCDQPRVDCKIIDDQVIGLMEGFYLPEDIIQMTLGELRKSFQLSRKDKKQDDRLFEILSRKKRIEFRFEVAGDMPENEYLYKTQKIKEEIERLDRQSIIKSMTPSQEEQFVKKTDNFLREFGKFWRSGLTDKEVQNWIRMVIKRVWVKNRKVVAIEPKDDFKPLFKSHMKVIGQAPLATPVGIFCFKFTESF